MMKINHLTGSLSHAQKGDAGILRHVVVLGTAQLCKTDVFSEIFYLIEGCRVRRNNAYPVDTKLILLTQIDIVEKEGCECFSNLEQGG